LTPFCHRGGTTRTRQIFTYKSPFSAFTYSYTQEIPSRFKKDIVRAAADESNDRIALDGMQRVLTNIGAENCLTSSEMKILFEELGNGTHMPVQNMSRII